MDPLEPARILVVEDEETIRLLVVDGLRISGYSTLEAADATHALALLEQNAIDLVFTDVRMPGPMNGADLAFVISDRWPSIPIIVGSGNFDAKSSRLPAGASFIAKPYRLSSLAALIEQHLTKRTRFVSHGGKLPIP